MVERAQRDAARRRRQAPGSAARWLWSLLRRRGFGAKVRRQAPFGPYIVDFCAHEARAVIVLRRADASGLVARSGELSLRAYLQALGYRLILLSEAEVLECSDAVLALLRVELAVTDASHPHPDLPPLAGEGASLLP